MRRSCLSLVMLVLAAVLPASAWADPPSNDGSASPVLVTGSYSDAPQQIAQIRPTGPAGGWTDATSTEDMVQNPPSCLGSVGFHSMWYQMTVPEASVLTVQLVSSAVDRYQPVVTIINQDGLNEVACGLGGSDQKTDPPAYASTYVPHGTYLIRVASVQNSITASNIELPTITLLGALRDVTPPQIQVSVFGKAKILGTGKYYTFDANGSKDLGSSIDRSSAVWEFYDTGAPHEYKGAGTMNPLAAMYRWETPGLHRVTLQLQDNAHNKNTYSFNVLVHNFIPPKVSLLVYVPSAGSRQIRVVLTHNVPVRVRLVVMQGSTVLRAIRSKLLKGSNAKTSLKLALRKRVGKADFVVVSGVASDLGQNPNTVPLLTCSVDPVHGGGTCA